MINSRPMNPGAAEYEDCWAGPRTHCGVLGFGRFESSDTGRFSDLRAPTDDLFVQRCRIDATVQRLDCAERLRKMLRCRRRTWPDRAPAATKLQCGQRVIGKGGKRIAAEFACAILRLRANRSKSKPKDVRVSIAQVSASKSSCAVPLWPRTLRVRCGKPGSKSTLMSIAARPEVASMRHRRNAPVAARERDVTVRVDPQTFGFANKVEKR